MNETTKREIVVDGLRAFILVKVSDYDDPRDQLLCLTGMRFEAHPDRYTSLDSIYKMVSYDDYKTMLDGYTAYDYMAEGLDEDQLKYLRSSWFIALDQTVSVIMKHLKHVKL